MATKAPSLQSWLMSHTIFGSRILEDKGVVLITDDHAFFFNDIMTHDKLGISGYPSPTDHPEAHPQF